MQPSGLQRPGLGEVRLFAEGLGDLCRVEHLRGVDGLQIIHLRGGRGLDDLEAVAVEALH